MDSLTCSHEWLPEKAETPEPTQTDEEKQAAVPDSNVVVVDWDDRARRLCADPAAASQDIGGLPDHAASMLADALVAVDAPFEAKLSVVLAASSASLAVRQALFARTLLPCVRAVAWRTCAVTHSATHSCSS